MARIEPFNTLLKFDDLNSPAKLAAAIDCSVGTLARWWSGKSTPGGDNYRRILDLCNRYGVDCNLNTSTQSITLYNDIINDLTSRVSILEENSVIIKEIPSVANSEIIELTKIVIDLKEKVTQLNIGLLDAFNQMEEFKKEIKTMRENNNA
jgi:transcriptional regulator with XRE-family HTH domain